MEANEQYALKEYWNQRYENEDEFEWFHGSFSTKLVSKLLLCYINTTINTGVITQL